MSTISVKDRIQTLLAEKRCSISQLCDGDESQRSKLSRQLNGHIGIQLSTIELVLNKFPDISADWLILGRGPREFADNLAPKVYTQGGAANIAKDMHFRDYMPNGTPIDKDLVIKAQEEIIDVLRDQNTILRQDNDAFRTLIAKLK